MNVTEASLQIVLIDDDKVNNMLTRRAFRKAGITAEFQEFLHAPDGLEWLANQEKYPDLIFLDINMPGMNGWDFLEAFHKQAIEVPVIMLTTSIDEEDRTRALSWDRVRDFLEKPLRPEALRASLGR